MNADDDMIVLIVGEGEKEDFSTPIKDDLLDSEEVEKIIEMAARHGELVDVSINDKLEEYEHNVEDCAFDDDEEYVPDGDENDEDEYYDDVDDGSGNETNNKHRHQMLKPEQQKSFVKELREQYPELKKHGKALVKTLSEIMRNVKPPLPPRDYFIMNGIMFECVKCGTLSETQPAACRHYQEKHGERYLICFACGVDFRRKQPVDIMTNKYKGAVYTYSTSNLYKHEKRCTAPDAVIVLKARARALGRLGRSRPYIPKNLPENVPVKKPSERKFPCSQCPAAFVAKTYLRSHEMLHRGVRPYTCSACPRAYTSLAALSRHRKKHGDDQFICDNCGRTFKIKAALVTHMDTHLPVKKYGCDQCEKRYATKGALRRHVLKKHLKLPPPCVCKICFKRYPLMSVLKDHMKKEHGLLIMTRKMFFESLPTLTETQIEQAKVVLKSELEPEDCDALNSSPATSPAASPQPIENSAVGIQAADQSSAKLTEEANPVMETRRKPLDHDDTDRTEQTIVLSEEVLQYMQSIQGDLGEGGNYNIIQDGQVLNSDYVGVHQILSNGQLLLHNGEYLVQSET